MKLTALFDNVGGLQSGNNIWFSGVKIGTVSGLHFYKDSQVEVTIRIDIKAQEYIRKDAKIKIGSDGLIGNKILEIYGGSLKSEIVEDGDVLQVEKTFTQEDMVNTLQENNFRYFIFIMDHFNNYILYFFNKNTLFVIKQFQSASE